MLPTICSMKTSILIISLIVGVIFGFILGTHSGKQSAQIYELENRSIFTNASLEHLTNGNQAGVEGLQKLALVYMLFDFDRLIESCFVRAKEKKMCRDEIRNILTTHKENSLTEMRFDGEYKDSFAEALKDLESALMMVVAKHTIEPSTPPNADKPHG